MSTTAERSGEVTEHESQQVERANASGRTPVVFIHGLWLLPSSWDRWAELFENAGFTAVKPGWPDDPETVSEAKAHPEVFAGKKVGQVADHVDAVIHRLNKKPVVMGHSFGGLLTQIVAGRGHSAASVAIDPAPFRGVLPRFRTQRTGTEQSRSPMSSSATRSPMPSPKRRRGSFTTLSPSRRPARLSFRPRPPT